LSVPTPLEFRAIFNLDPLPDEFNYYPEKSWASPGVGRGMRTTPFWEKSLKLTVKIRYTEQIFEIDRENPGFEKTTPLAKSWRRP
jgi:hypothetical protein